MWVMFKVASWNLNSVRSRLTHVTAWLQAREPDVLLLQELKGTEFPSEVFKSLGYESVAVTQKAYNGVAILSRHPMETVAKALVGDDSDSHARFLEVIIKRIRIVNIYLPNGNPVGSDKFAYKLAWMDRLNQQMIRWKQDDVVPTLIGGDFNVIPEDIDCHKPSSSSVITSKAANGYQFKTGQRSSRPGLSCSTLLPLVEASQFWCASCADHT
jgi:exodeoxyribonuclease-3